MKRIAALVWLVAILSFAAYAQSPSASLRGRITDVSKSVVVNARILAINVGTNIPYGGATNSAGEYYIPNLLPGTYRIEAQKTGFSTVIKPDIVLHVEEEVEINFELGIGSVSQSITVEAGAPMLEPQHLRARGSGRLQNRSGAATERALLDRPRVTAAGRRGCRDAGELHRRSRSGQPRLRRTGQHFRWTRSAEQLSHRRSQCKRL